MTIEEAKAKLVEIAESIKKGTYHGARLDYAGRGGEVRDTGKCGLYLEDPPNGVPWPDGSFGWFYGATFEEAFEELDRALNPQRPARFPLFQPAELAGLPIDKERKPYCGVCGCAPVRWNTDGTFQCPECGYTDASFQSVAAAIEDPRD